VSGRPKYTDAEERLRALTREAHEAVQELRLVLREVRAARADHAGALDKTLQLAVDAGTEQITDHALRILDSLESAGAKLGDQIAGILGADSKGELAQMIVSQAAAELARDLMIGLDKDGRAAIVPRPVPQVFVTADPGVAPAGSLVIDAR
jgi:hypothetical protein